MLEKLFTGVVKPPSKFDALHSSSDFFGPRKTMDKAAAGSDDSSAKLFAFNKTSQEKPLMTHKKSDNTSNTARKDQLIVYFRSSIFNKVRIKMPTCPAAEQACLTADTSS